MSANDQAIEEAIENLEHQLNILRINHQREIQQLNSTIQVLRNTRPERPVPEHIEPNIQPQPPRRGVEDRAHRGHQIGDRVRIINNYQDLQGTAGTITYISGHRVFIRIFKDNEHRIVRRAHHNVELIEDEE
jgi:hypothetical protein